jgi:cell division septation protein DedD
MDSGMRDLERIEERENDESPRRRLGVLLLAGLATFGVVVSLGIVMSRAGADPTPNPETALAGATALWDRGEEEVEPERQPVARDSVTFPEALEGSDARPEVDVSVAQAAQELAELEASGIPATVAAARPFESRAFEGAERPPFVPAPSMAETPPPFAGDPPPIVPHDRARAPEGRDGEYTLQVISYETRAAADIFADELRVRGHRAFVMVADVPDRGRHYRVRIGPFETQREVDEYRRTFESTEGMNTFVVKRRDDDDAPVIVRPE